MNSIYFQRKSKLTRIVALFTVLFFLFSCFTPLPGPGFSHRLYASEAPVNSLDGITDIRDLCDLRIPELYGQVKESFIGDAGKTVVLIQDYHCNYRAQQNIAEILSLFHTGQLKHLFRSVNVEGAAGAVDGTTLTSLPEGAIKEKILDYMLKEGFISGSESFLADNNEAISLYGVENKELYFENVAYFKESMEYADGVKKLLLSLDNQLNILGKKIFSDELKAVYDMMRFGHQNREQLYVLYNNEAFKQGIDLGKFTHFQKMLASSKLEEGLDLNAMYGERQELFSELGKILVKEEAAALMAQTLKYRTGRITTPRFYLFLSKMMNENDIDSNRFPQLKRYMDLVSIQEDIDDRILVDEIDSIETILKESLFQNQLQKELDGTKKRIRILTDLFNFSLRRKDYEYLQTHRDEFWFERIKEFIEMQGGDVSSFAFQGLQDFDQYITYAENFYKVLVERDYVLIRNTLSHMEKEGFSLSVLVSGGFHTEGMIEELRERGVSYFVVLPMGDVAQSDVLYHEMLERKRTALATVLSQAGRRLAPLLRLVNEMSEEDEVTDLKRAIFVLLSEYLLEDITAPGEFDSMIDEVRAWGEQVGVKGTIESTDEGIVILFEGEETPVSLKNIIAGVAEKPAEKELFSTEEKGILTAIKQMAGKKGFTDTKLVLNGREVLGVPEGSTTPETLYLFAWPVKLFAFLREINEAAAGELFDDVIELVLAHEKGHLSVTEQLEGGLAVAVQERQANMFGRSELSDDDEMYIRRVASFIFFQYILQRPDYEDLVKDTKKVARIVSFYLSSLYPNVSINPDDLSTVLQRVKEYMKQFQTFTRSDYIALQRTLVVPSRMRAEILLYPPMGTLFEGAFSAQNVIDECSRRIQDVYRIIREDDVQKARQELEEIIRKLEMAKDSVSEDDREVEKQLDYLLALTREQVADLDSPKGLNAVRSRALLAELNISPAGELYSRLLSQDYEELLEKVNVLRYMGMNPVQPPLLEYSLDKLELDVQNNFIFLIENNVFAEGDQVPEDLLLVEHDTLLERAQLLMDEEINLTSERLSLSVEEINTRIVHDQKAGRELAGIKEELLVLLKTDELPGNLSRIMELYEKLLALFPDEELQTQNNVDVVTMIIRTRLKAFIENLASADTLSEASRNYEVLGSLEKVLESVNEPEPFLGLFTDINDLLMGFRRKFEILRGKLLLHALFLAQSAADTENLRKKGSDIQNSLQQIIDEFNLMQKIFPEDTRIPLEKEVCENISSLFNEVLEAFSRVSSWKEKPEERELEKLGEHLGILDRICNDLTELGMTGYEEWMGDDQAVHFQDSLKRLLKMIEGWSGFLCGSIDAFSGSINTILDSDAASEEKQSLLNTLFLAAETAGYDHVGVLMMRAMKKFCRSGFGNSFTGLFERMKEEVKKLEKEGVFLSRQVKLLFTEIEKSYREELHTEQPFFEVGVMPGIPEEDTLFVAEELARIVPEQGGFFQTTFNRWRERVFDQFPILNNSELVSLTRVPVVALPRAEWAGEQGVVYERGTVYIDTSVFDADKTTMKDALISAFSSAINERENSIRKKTAFFEGLGVDLASNPQLLLLDADNLYPPDSYKFDSGFVKHVLDPAVFQDTRHIVPLHVPEELGIGKDFSGIYRTTEGVSIEYRDGVPVSVFVRETGEWLLVPSPDSPDMTGYSAISGGVTVYFQDGFPVEIIKLSPLERLVGDIMHPGDIFSLLIRNGDAFALVKENPDSGTQISASLLGEGEEARADTLVDSFTQALPDPETFEKDVREWMLQPYNEKDIYAGVDYLLEAISLSTGSLRSVLEEIKAGDLLYDEDKGTPISDLLRSELIETLSLERGLDAHEKKLLVSAVTRPVKTPVRSILGGLVSIVSAIFAGILIMNPFVPNTLTMMVQPALAAIQGDTPAPPVPTLTQPEPVSVDDLLPALLNLEDALEDRTQDLVLQGGAGQPDVSALQEEETDLLENIRDLSSSIAETSEEVGNLRQQRERLVSQKNRLQERYRATIARAEESDRDRASERGPSPLARRFMPREINLEQAIEQAVRHQREIPRSELEVASFLYRAAQDSDVDFSIETGIRYRSFAYEIEGSQPREIQRGELIGLLRLAYDYDPGRAARIDMALNHWERAQAQAGQSEHELVRNVIGAYIDVLRFQEEERVMEEYLQGARQLHEAAERMVAEERMTSERAAPFRGEINRARRALLEVQSHKREAIRELSLFMGYPGPRSDLELEGEFTREGLQNLITSQLTEAYPDMRDSIYEYSEAALAAEGEMIADRARQPSINVSALFDVTGRYSDAEPEDPGSVDLLAHDVWSLDATAVLELRIAYGLLEWPEARERNRILEAQQRAVRVLREEHENTELYLQTDSRLRLENTAAFLGALDTVDVPDATGNYDNPEALYDILNALRARTNTGVERAVSLGGYGRARSDFIQSGALDLQESRAPHLRGLRIENAIQTALHNSTEMRRLEADRDRVHHVIRLGELSRIPELEVFVSGRGLVSSDPTIAPDIVEGEAGVGLELRGTLFGVTPEEDRAARESLEHVESMRDMARNRVIEDIYEAFSDYFARAMLQDSLQQRQSILDERAQYMRDHLERFGQADVEAAERERDQGRAELERENGRVRSAKLDILRAMNYPNPEANVDALQIDDDEFISLLAVDYRPGAELENLRTEIEIARQMREAAGRGHPVTWFVTSRVFWNTMGATPGYEIGAGLEYRFGGPADLDVRVQDARLDNLRETEAFYEAAREGRIRDAREAFDSALGEKRRLSELLETERAHYEEMLERYRQRTLEVTREMLFSAQLEINDLQRRLTESRSALIDRSFNLVRLGEELPVSVDEFTGREAQEELSRVTQAMSLERAVAAAVENNRRIRDAQTELEVRRQELRRVRTLHFLEPASVRLGAGILAGEAVGTDTETRTGEETEYRFNGGFRYSVDMEEFFRAYDIQQAQTRVDEAEAQLEQVRIEVTLDIVEAYYDLLLAREIERAREEHGEEADDILSLVRTRYTSRLRAEFGDERSAQRETVISRIFTAEDPVNAAQRRIRELLEVTYDIVPEGEINLDRIRQISSPHIESLLEDATAGDPRMREQRARIEAGRIAVDRAPFESWGRLDLTVLGMHEIAGENRDFNAGLMLRFNINEIVEGRHRQEVVQVVLDREEAELEEVERRIQTDLANYVDRFNTSVRMAHEARNAFEEAQSYYETLDRQFRPADEEREGRLTAEESRASLTDFLGAFSAYQEARRDYLRAYAQAETGYEQLERFLGRFDIELSEILEEHAGFAPEIPESRMPPAMRLVNSRLRRLENRLAVSMVRQDRLRSSAEEARRSLADVRGQLIAAEQGNEQSDRIAELSGRAQTEMEDLIRPLREREQPLTPDEAADIIDSVDGILLSYGMEELREEFYDQIDELGLNEAGERDEPVVDEFDDRRQDTGEEDNEMFEEVAPGEFLGSDVSRLHRERLADYMLADSHAILDMVDERTGLPFDSVRYMDGELLPENMTYRLSNTAVYLGTLIGMRDVRLFDEDPQRNDSEARRRVMQTLETLQGLPHYRGFFYTAYNDRLLPEEDRRLSTVDNANLTASLISLRGAYADDADIRGLVDDILGRQDYTAFIDYSYNNGAYFSVWLNDSGDLSGEHYEHLGSESLTLYLVASLLNESIYPESLRELQVQFDYLQNSDEEIIPVPMSVDGAVFQIFMPTLFLNIGENSPLMQLLYENFASAMSLLGENGLMAAYSACQGEEEYEGKVGITRLDMFPGEEGERSDLLTPHALFLALPFSSSDAMDSLLMLEELYPEAYDNRFGWLDSVNIEQGEVVNRMLFLDKGMSFLGAQRMFGSGLGTYFSRGIEGLRADPERNLEQALDELEPVIESEISENMQYLVPEQAELPESTQNVSESPFGDGTRALRGAIERESSRMFEDIGVMTTDWIIPEHFFIVPEDAEDWGRYCWYPRISRDIDAQEEMRQDQARRYDRGVLARRRLEERRILSEQHEYERARNRESMHESQENYNQALDEYISSRLRARNPQYAAFYRLREQPMRAEIPPHRAAPRDAVVNRGQVYSLLRGLGIRPSRSRVMDLNDWMHVFEDYRRAHDLTAAQMNEYLQWMQRLAPVVKREIRRRGISSSRLIPSYFAGQFDGLVSLEKQSMLSNRDVGDPNINLSELGLLSFYARWIMYNRTYNDTFAGMSNDDILRDPERGILHDIDRDLEIMAFSHQIRSGQQFDEETLAEYARDDELFRRRVFNAEFSAVSPDDMRRSGDQIRRQLEEAYRLIWGRDRELRSDLVSQGYLSTWVTYMLSHEGTDLMNQAQIMHSIQGMVRDFYGPVLLSTLLRHRDSGRLRYFIQSAEQAQAEGREDDVRMFRAEAAREEARLRESIESARLMYWARQIEENRLQNRSSRQSEINRLRAHFNRMRRLTGPVNELYSTHTNFDNLRYMGLIGYWSDFMSDYGFNIEQIEELFDEITHVSNSQGIDDYIRQMGIPVGRRVRISVNDYETMGILTYLATSKILHGYEEDDMVRYLEESSEELSNPEVLTHLMIHYYMTGQDEVGDDMVAYMLNHPRMRIDLEELVSWTERVSPNLVERVNRAGRRAVENPISEQETRLLRQRLVAWIDEFVMRRGGTTEDIHDILQDVNAYTTYISILLEDESDQQKRAYWQEMLNPSNTIAWVEAMRNEGYTISDAHGNLSYQAKRLLDTTGVVMEAEDAVVPELTDHIERSIQRVLDDRGRQAVVGTGAGDWILRFLGFGEYADSRIEHQGREQSRMYFDELFGEGMYEMLQQDGTRAVVSAIGRDRLMETARESTGDMQFFAERMLLYDLIDDIANVRHPLTEDEIQYFAMRFSDEHWRSEEVFTYLVNRSYILASYYLYNDMFENFSEEHIEEGYTHLYVDERMSESELNRYITQLEQGRFDRYELADFRMRTRAYILHNERELIDRLAGEFGMDRTPARFTEEEITAFVQAAQDNRWTYEDIDWWFETAFFIQSTFIEELGYPLDYFYDLSYVINAFERESGVSEYIIRWRMRRIINDVWTSTPSRRNYAQDDYSFYEFEYNGRNYQVDGNRYRSMLVQAKMTNLRWPTPEEINRLLALEQELINPAGTSTAPVARYEAVYFIKDMAARETIMETTLVGRIGNQLLARVAGTDRSMRDVLTPLIDSMQEGTDELFLERFRNGWDRERARRGREYIQTMRRKDNEARNRVLDRSREGSLFRRPRDLMSDGDRNLLDVLQMEDPILALDSMRRLYGGYVIDAGMLEVIENLVRIDDYDHEDVETFLSNRREVTRLLYYAVTMPLNEYERFLEGDYHQDISEEDFLRYSMAYRGDIGYLVSLMEEHNYSLEDVRRILAYRRWIRSTWNERLGEDISKMDADTIASACFSRGVTIHDLDVLVNTTIFLRASAEENGIDIPADVALFIVNENMRLGVIPEPDFTIQLRNDEETYQIIERELDRVSLFFTEEQRDRLVAELAHSTNENRVPLSHIRLIIDEITSITSGEKFGGDETAYDALRDYFRNQTGFDLTEEMLLYFAARNLGYDLFNFVDSRGAYDASVNDRLDDIGLADVTRLRSRRLTLSLEINNAIERVFQDRFDNEMIRLFHDESERRIHEMRESVQTLFGGFIITGLPFFRKKSKEKDERTREFRTYSIEILESLFRYLLDESQESADKRIKQLLRGVAKDAPVREEFEKISLQEVRDVRRLLEVFSQEEEVQLEIARTMLDQLLVDVMEKGDTMRFLSGWNKAVNTADYPRETRDQVIRHQELFAQRISQLAQDGQALEELMNLIKKTDTASLNHIAGNIMLMQQTEPTAVVIDISTLDENTWKGFVKDLEKAENTVVFLINHDPGLSKEDLEGWQERMEAHAPKLTKRILSASLLPKEGETPQQARVRGEDLLAGLLKQAQGLTESKTRITRENMVLFVRKDHALFYAAYRRAITTLLDDPSEKVLSAEDRALLEKLGVKDVSAVDRLLGEVIIGTERRNELMRIEEETAKKG